MHTEWESASKAGKAREGYNVTTVTYDFGDVRDFRILAFAYIWDFVQCINTHPYGGVRSYIFLFKKVVTTVTLLPFLDLQGLQR